MTTKLRTNYCSGRSLVLHYSNIFLIEQPSFPSHLNLFLLKATSVSAGNPPSEHSTSTYWLSAGSESRRAELSQCPLRSCCRVQRLLAGLCSTHPGLAHEGGSGAHTTLRGLHPSSSSSSSLPPIYCETPERSSRLLMTLTDLLYTPLKQRFPNTRQLPEGRTSTSPCC